MCISLNLLIDVARAHMAVQYRISESWMMFWKSPTLCLIAELLQQIDTCLFKC